MINKLQKLLKIINEILFILLILHNLINLTNIDQMFQFKEIHFGIYIVFSFLCNIFVSELNISNRLFRIHALKFHLMLGEIIIGGN